MMVLRGAALAVGMVIASSAYGQVVPDQIAPADPLQVQIGEVKQRIAAYERAKREAEVRSAALQGLLATDRLTLVQLEARAPKATGGSVAKK